MKAKEPDVDEELLPEWRTTRKIIGCFFETYNILGYGFLEAVYRRALAQELVRAGLTVAQEVAVTASFKGKDVGFFRLDLVVDERVAIEVKATFLLGPTDKRQLLNYLRATSIDVGLLLHFGPSPKFHRIVAPRLLDRQR
jgi:GxxExxY protein